MGAEKVEKLFAALAALVTLSGCATRGPIAIKCDEFKTYTHEVPRSQLITEIQDGQGPISLLPTAASIVSMSTDPMQMAFNAMAAGQFAPEQNGEQAVLLLSGGGQWGAFGAGYLDYLHDQKRLPNFQTITGVSTGGLQSLFVAVNEDTVYAKLLEYYAPKMESDVVNRHGWQPLAAITGSLAGLKPLRAKIEKAICPDNGDSAEACPLIKKIADSNKNVYIGFVEAQSGKMEYFDAGEIAKQAPQYGYRRVQQCLTGAALASVAMPAFFQQVRVNGKTYYDGGVRQSVFEVMVADKINKAVHSRMSGSEVAQAAGPAQSARLPLYVIRNGPTTVKEDNETGDPKECNADCKADLITNALRAEAIVVNELEIGSIAALRLVRPDGPISLITADGYNRPFTLPNGTVETGCVKLKDVMFDPAFMLCLQGLGRSKAARDPSWRALSEIKTAMTIDESTPPGRAEQ